MYVSVVICTHLNYVCTTAPPMTAPNITGTTPLSSTSFTVSWTITDPTHNYIIIWTNLRTGMISGVTVPENTNSYTQYTITGLNGIDSYNVTVTTNSSCGMMISDPITVYGKNVHIAHSIPYTSKHSRGKTFAVHQQCALCRENFRSLQP